MSVTPRRGRPVRVAVVNDYDLVVAGVAALLARHHDEVEVTELVVGREAPEAPVDVVLFDTYGARLDRLAELKATPSVGKVAVYTLAWDAELVRRVLADGADAVLSKSLPGHQLAADLTRVAEGQAVVDPGPPTPSTVDRPQAWPGAEHDLTERESEVLALAAAGLSNAEVGLQLHLGVNTVKTHLRNAYRKAGVRNRAQAAAYVLRQRPGAVALHAPVVVDRGA